MHTHMYTQSSCVYTCVYNMCRVAVWGDRAGFGGGGVRLPSSLSMGYLGIDMYDIWGAGFGADRLPAL